MKSTFFGRKNYFLFWESIPFGEKENEKQLPKKGYGWGGELRRDFFWKSAQ